MAFFGYEYTANTMKIQLASDLHLEFFERKFPDARVITPHLDADILVLAGDIHSGAKAIEAFKNWPVPVLYVAGNHEFYGRSWEQTRIDIKQAAAGTNVTFLDNNSVEIGGVRILGCTLWTDYRSQGSLQSKCMKDCEMALSDHLQIRTQEGLFKARHALKDHEHSRAWLERELAKPFGGKTVVITHHGPHPLSIHPRFSGDRVNPGFVSDLSPLLSSVNLWLHGHVHDSIEYQVGLCRVMANPAGYCRNLAVAYDFKFEFENSKFDAGLVVDV
jgi:Icc-related predicted phosphoesterase